MALTDSSEPIDPTWDWISGESNTGIVTEMVAVFGNQIICIPSVLSGELLHDRPHLRLHHVRFPNQNRLSISKSIALFWFPFKNSSCWILVSSKCVLYTMD